MGRFVAKLEPVPHGGLFVVVPAAVVAKAGLAHGARVRGTVNDAPYRSALMKYSGVFHLGVHKATVQAAGIARGDRVSLTIEADREPLPTDLAPDDLAKALSEDRAASESWKSLAPAVRRGYVKSVLEAKKPQTRARRIATIVETLHQGVPPRRTWVPPTGQGDDHQGDREEPTRSRLTRVRRSGPFPRPRSGPTPTRHKG